MKSLVTNTHFWILQLLLNSKGNIAIYVSELEWGKLDSWQKEFYMYMIRGDYETPVFLGYATSK